MTNLLQPAPTSDTELKNLWAGLRSGTAVLNKQSTKTLVCSGAWVVKLSEMAWGHDQPTVEWSGRAVDSVRFLGEGPSGNLWVDHGTIDGTLSIGDGRRFTGQIAVLEGGSVSGDLVIEGQGTELKGSVTLGQNAKVGGSIGVSNGSTVHGDLKVLAGHVEKGVLISGAQVTGTVDLAGDVGVLHIGPSGSVGNLVIRGKVDTLKIESGTVTRDTVLSPSAPMSIETLDRAQFGAAAEIGDNVSLASCDLRNFHQVDRLKFSRSTFDCGRTKCDTNHTMPVEIDLPSLSRLLRCERAHILHEGLTPPELVGVYRRLRLACEQTSDRSLAADFYFREMDARRQSAETGTWDKTVLWAFRFMSEYGTRTYLPAFWFVMTLIVSSFLFVLCGVDLEAGPRIEFQQNADFRGGDVILFSAESMLSFFRSPPSDKLSGWERALQIYLRFAGPLLLAQVFLAVRTRVAR